MEIPHSLRETIREGRAVLFLGSGASVGAVRTCGEGFPMGNHLRDIISDKFLGGEDKDQPLSVIAEYAISETDLITVQHFLRDIFYDGDPADFHRLVASFRWAGLATTNYDLVIERVYESSDGALQELVPFISDRDRVDHKLRSENALPYLKLHGCISRCDEPSLPLILTIDQYVTHRKQRDMLFRRLSEWGSEYPIVFVGQQLQDSDLRQVLLELAGEGMERPRFYVVTPNPSERQIRFWETKRITALSGTLEEFLVDLDRDTDPALRAVKLPEREHLIEKKFKDNDAQLSVHGIQMLNHDVTYLHPDLPTKKTNPFDFYRGYSYGWDAIRSSYDSARNLVDTILSDTVLIDDVDRPSVGDFYLIKGHAGSGKTVIMKRIAWEAMAEYDKISLYLETDRELDVEAIFEIIEKVGERVLLFVEKAVNHIPEIQRLVRKAREGNYPLTVFAETRTNEWNVDNGSLEALINEVFEVKYLSRNEIPRLIDKLEEQRALGLLARMSETERIEAFENKAGRQILVALHEATLGKPFEDIVYDEFRNINPDEARQVYLTICSLNRLDVPVRAGLINRVHQISFEKFKDEFFGPLESVVFTREYYGHDMAYSARHPWVAEVVFERSLPNPESRLDLYLALLEALDVGYEADRTAFRSLIRARGLLDLFADPKMVRAIYDAASSIGSDDPYYYQQRAIYEMKRDNPAFSEAYELLRKASDLSPTDRSITHSMAELELQRAEYSRDSREARRHLEAASKLATRLTGRSSSNSFGYHTLCKISLQKLREVIQTATNSDQVVTEAIKEAESQIQNALQRYPDDEYLLDAESQLSDMIGASEKAKNALQRAFARNPMSPYIARRLARLYENVGEFNDAKDVLTKCLEGLPNDRGVHAALAMLLTKYSPNRGEDAEYHWRRSFTDGDANYDCQFWYARQLWLNNKKEEANKYFMGLRSARVSPKVRQEVRGKVMNEDSTPTQLRGRIERLEENYAFLSNELSDEWTFLHRSNAPEDVWESLEYHTPVTYQLGFNYRGLAAINVKA